MPTKTAKRRLTVDQERLLALLRRNAREPTASLARKLGVARTTVQERIRRLERDGVIAGYTVRVSEGFARQRIAAQVLVHVDPKSGERVVRALDAQPWVRAVYALSGVFDYEVRIEGGSTEQIDRYLDAIGRIEGIQRTQTSIVLSVKFER
ncbi:MAG TPA: Lrp/AsnC family transcriptional regulator [Casimicrobiaceae bacterium]|jgi:DNA-binding Lrp family transcriptional regulator|nr:Lrp/AsnC family transcriptional regulator [Casimicrobiaceae bacterium]